MRRRRFLDPLLQQSYEELSQSMTSKGDADDARKHTKAHNPQEETNKWSKPTKMNTND